MEELDGFGEMNITILEHVSNLDGFRGCMDNHTRQDFLQWTQWTLPSNILCE